MSEPTEDPGLTALAEAMKARMDHLGLTITDVAQRGGPQRGAMREILHARRRPRISTLHELDTVLGWPDGVAADILATRRDQPAPDEWLDLPGENRLGLIRSHLLQMDRDVGRIRRQLDAHSEAMSELLALIEEERIERQ